MMGKSRLFLIVLIFFLDLFAQENNEILKYNYCTYINGAKLVSIDMNTSITKLQKTKANFQKGFDQFDIYYYEIMYSNNTLEKVSKYKLIKNQLVEEYFFNRNKFLKKKVIYTNKEKNICILSYNFLKKKATEECSDGSKTINFYKSFYRDVYQQLYYQDNKYVGKSIKDWEKGTYKRYDSNDNIIYKTDEISHFTDTCGTLVRD